MQDRELSKSLLLVEDNEDDQFIMRRALEGAGLINPLIIVEDGESVVQYLQGAGKYSDRATYPMPALIFLDLKLPLRSGLDVLKWIRSQPELTAVVVVVLTSSSEARDITMSYRLGANSYLVKPPTPCDLLEMAKAFKWFWLEFNHFAEPL
jgi:CheY-like chemotaxis protein